MTHNLELKNYLCELCGKSFKIRWSLIAHKLAHTKSKFHKCSKCKSVFSSYPSLRRHYLSHSGKHYLCNYCDIKCQRKDNLIRHIRNTHPGKDTAYINNKLHKCVKRSLSYDKPIKKQIVFEMNKDKNKNSDKEDLVPNINTSNNILLDSNTIPHNSNKDPMDYSNGFSLQEKKFRIPVINGPIKLSFKNMQHSVNNVNSLNTSKNDNSKACEDHHIEIYRKILQAPSARKTLGSSTETSGSIEPTFNNINKTNTSKSLNGIDSLSDEQRKEYQHIEIYRKILMPSYTQKDKVDSNCYKSNTLKDHFTETQSPEKFHASILTSDNKPYTNYISSDKMGEINHKDYDNHVSTITLVAGNKIMCSLNEDVRTVPTMINL
ncbi:zinc finger protein 717-like [Ctenocephalides felis]|uniref:zinc finger protein 717-like n=1 Tax=Ctenocephalides felis TaxID=7515 RepID=UPI000E6E4B13|nr:zinc finger protein 717-like [Ctenocephalides felis]